MDLRLLLPSKSLLLLPPSKPLFLSPRFHSRLLLSTLPSNSKHRNPPFNLTLSCSHQPKNAVEGLDLDLPQEHVGPPAAAAVDSLGSPTIWGQTKEIALFAGPATGLWLCGPLMSLIDTMVIGQASSIELAAMGPGTVFVDNLSYTFMFLSIATSNMVATSLAKKDRNLVQHQISMLLFVAFSCGLGMLLFTKLLGVQVLSAFTGSENLHLLPAANTYVQIRGFAWPAVLVGMVAQSASLGMKDSWGPLKALAIASVINGIGDVLLCCVFKYGIAGAAWATMLSQVLLFLFCPSAKPEFRFVVLPYEENSSATRKRPSTN